MIKNAEQAFLWNGTVLTQITDPDYPGIFETEVDTLTRTGTTATATTVDPTNIETGSSVVIAGATETAYNGTYTVTVTGADTFTYTVAGSPATPATGTITVRGGRTTVPGIVFLDGYFFVMDAKAKIYGCELEAPNDWDALNFITAQKEPGAGKAIAKSQNYVIAFKEWSTEFFFNAGNAVGSPLSPVDSGFTLVGCASGESVATLDETIFWVSQNKQKGRSVHMMVGLEQQKVSTPDVERVLNLDDLGTVYAYGVKISGHSFYVLTLKNSNVTLVYDAISQKWGQWTSLVAGTALDVASLTYADGKVTVVTDDPHLQTDGNVITISGADNISYNGDYVIKVVDSTTFTYETNELLNSPATGTITATPYTETYFKYTKYVNANGIDVVLHESDGHMYELSPEVYKDNLSPVSILIRTGKLDMGTTDLKTCGKAEIIGNKVDSLAYIRFSDDDFRSFSRYRMVDLSATHPVVRRMGDFERRSFDVKHVGNSAIQLSELELDLGA